MRLLREGVFSVPPCLSVKALLSAAQAMALVLALAPAAWPQVATPNPARGAATAPSDPQQGGTADAANDRITQLALVQAAKKTDYVLDSGDLLGIEVFDVQELTRDVRISESGLISLPLLPVRVRAAGLTAFQLQDKLAELLLANGLVSHPEVTVSVKEQHGQPITVMGAVRTPMVIQAVRQMTLLEVLSRAGGIADDAAGQILITHAPKAAVREESEVAAVDGAEPSTEAVAPEAAPVPAESVPAEPLTVRVSLSDLLDSGDSRFNLALRGGDVVSVPRAGVVYAVGALQRPGGFVMANDRQQLTVLKVLALAGGLTGTAKAKNAVIIRQSVEANQR